MKKLLFKNVGLSRSDLRLVWVAGALSVGTVILDFLTTLAIPKVIDALTQYTNMANLFSIHGDAVFSGFVILVRPLVSVGLLWLQLKVILSLLLSIENRIIANNLVILRERSDWPSERISSLFINHGRYYVDGYLLPLIRALTEFSSLFAVVVGIFMLFPVGGFVFFVILTASFAAYRLFLSDALKRLGRQLLLIYETFMSLGRETRLGNSVSWAEIERLWVSSAQAKHDTSFFLGITSQGLKFFVEFTFMLGFGLSAVCVLFYSPEKLGAFGASFAYAAMRAIPALTAIMAFLQSSDTAAHSIDELRAAMLHNSSIYIK